MLCIIEPVRVNKASTSKLSQRSSMFRSPSSATPQAQFYSMITLQCCKTTCTHIHTGGKWRSINLVYVGTNTCPWSNELVLYPGNLAKVVNGVVNFKPHTAVWRAPIRVQIREDTTWTKSESLPTACQLSTRMNINQSWVSRENKWLHSLALEPKVALGNQMERWVDVLLYLGRKIPARELVDLMIESGGWYPLRYHVCYRNSKYLPLAWFRNLLPSVNAYRHLLSSWEAEHATW